jgi:hypothetical protein
VSPFLSARKERQLAVQEFVKHVCKIREKSSPATAGATAFPRYINSKTDQKGNPIDIFYVTSHRRRMGAIGNVRKSQEKRISTQ